MQTELQARHLRASETNLQVFRKVLTWRSKRHNKNKTLRNHVAVAEALRTGGNHMTKLKSCFHQVSTRPLLSKNNAEYQEEILLNKNAWVELASVKHSFQLQNMIPFLGFVSLWDLKLCLARGKSQGTKF